jgi:hypothetical protein
MKYAVFLLALSALAFAASAPHSGDAGHQHGEEAYMPSQCPFVNTNSGFRCLGIPIPNGYYVGGEKYRCSNGHTWVVSSR